MQNPTMITNLIIRSLFILFLLLLSYKALAQPYRTLVAPLKKSTTTPLYTIILNSNQHYVVDLTAPFSWQRCSTQHRQSVDCFSSPCIQASYLPSSCNLLPGSSQIPCFCIVTPINPITKSCALGELISSNLTTFWTNGANPTAQINLSELYLSCAPSSLFQGLPREVVGLTSLSRAPLSLPSQVSQLLGLSEKFAVCLPSTSVGNGVIFFGDGPYNLLPSTNFDASSLLSYTPFLINPKSANYFIGIKALSISGKSIEMSPYEGVKLSTTLPYTTLRTDIYKIFVEFFTSSMKGIPRTKNVKPFNTCYNASAIGFSRVGLHVPQIDLEFDNGKNWTIFGANSMKQVGRDSACLAFLDGGKTAEYKIEIGSFQMEDNLLVFDLDQSRFGFSSSLYFERMTCSNFNFTTKV